MLRITWICIALLSLVGCMKGVQEEDLTSWVNQPVSLLDTHPLFMTVPMERRFSNDGVEIRNYRNGRTVSSCSGNTNFNVNSGYANSYANCFENDNRGESVSITVRGFEQLKMAASTSSKTRMPGL